eukprot:3003081-Prorocentrum_lima.AAC.1
MCIRDRVPSRMGYSREKQAAYTFLRRSLRKLLEVERGYGWLQEKGIILAAVSYTHQTLPTICSV